MAAPSPSISSLSSSGSGSASASDVAVAVPQTKPLDAGESCSFLSVDSSRGCRAARSCASCLETTGCMINAAGKCVDPRDEHYDPSLEYRHAISMELVITGPAQAKNEEPQLWQFPAGIVRYCSADDVKCRACTSANFWRSNSTLPDSRFCLGDDGVCVCVDACERRWYVQDNCTLTATAPTASASSDAAVGILWRGLAGMVALSLFLVAFVVRKKCSPEELARVRLLESRQAREARRAARAQALGVNPLTLTGWESYRRSLIDKEEAERLRANVMLQGVAIAPNNGLSREERDDIRSLRTSASVSTTTASAEESNRSLESTRFAPDSTAAREMRISVGDGVTPGHQRRAPLASPSL